MNDFLNARQIRQLGMTNQVAELAEEFGIKPDQLKFLVTGADEGRKPRLELVNPDILKSPVKQEGEGEMSNEDYLKELNWMQDLANKYGISINAGGFTIDPHLMSHNSAAEKQYAQADHNNIKAPDVPDKIDKTNAIT